MTPDRRPRRFATPRAAWRSLDRRQRLLVLFVADRRLRTGAGPTFRELGSVAGSTCRSGDWALVRGLGPVLVHERDVPRSLDVVPELRPEVVDALDELRRARTRSRPVSQPEKEAPAP
jgi:hypothetical protein